MVSLSGRNLLRFFSSCSLLVMFLTIFFLFRFASRSDTARAIAWQEPPIDTEGLVSKWLESPEELPVDEPVIVIKDQLWVVIVMKRALTKPCFFSHYYYDGEGFWDLYTRKQFTGYQDTTWNKKVWVNLPKLRWILFKPRLRY